MNPFASLLSWLCDGYWPAADRPEAVVVRARDTQQRYTPLDLLASGDTADIHVASTVDASGADRETHYLLKLSLIHI